MRPAEAANGQARARTWVVILGPSLVSFVPMAMAPALPRMAEHFAGERDGALFAQLVMTVPAVLLIVSATLAGMLAERIGRRRVLIAALLLFILAGTAGLYAPDANTLIASRLLLGLAGGAVLTSSLSLAGDFPEGGARERVLGFAGAGGAAGAIVALNAGGSLVDAFGWRGPFALYALGLVALASRLVRAAAPRARGCRAPRVARAAHAVLADLPSRDRIRDRALHAGDTGPVPARRSAGHERCDPGTRRVRKLDRGRGCGVELRLACAQAHAAPAARVRRGLPRRRLPGQRIREQRAHDRAGLRADGHGWRAQRAGARVRAVLANAGVDAYPGRRPAVERHIPRPVPEPARRGSSASSSSASAARSLRSAACCCCWPRCLRPESGDVPDYWASMATLCSSARTSLVWRSNPVLEKMARRCARAVFGLMPSSSAAS